MAVLCLLTIQRYTEMTTHQGYLNHGSHCQRMPSTRRRRFSSGIEEQHQLTSSAVTWLKNIDIECDNNVITV